MATNVFRESHVFFKSNVVRISSEVMVTVDSLSN